MEIDSDYVGCLFWLVGLASIVLLFVNLHYALLGGVTTAVLFVAGIVFGETSSDYLLGGFWFVVLASVALLFVDLEYALLGGITAMVLFVAELITANREKQHWEQENRNRERHKQQEMAQQLEAALVAQAEAELQCKDIVGLIDKYLADAESAFTQLARYARVGIGKPVSSD